MFTLLKMEVIYIPAIFTHDFLPLNNILSVLEPLKQTNPAHSNILKSIMNLGKYIQIALLKY